MFACSVTLRCPSDEAALYYHLYFQKNKQRGASRAISIPSFDCVPLPMSARVLVKMLAGGKEKGDEIEKTRKKRKGFYGLEGFRGWVQLRVKPHMAFIRQDKPSHMLGLGLDFTPLLMSTAIHDWRGKMGDRGEKQYSNYKLWLARWNWKIQWQ